MAALSAMTLTAQPAAAIETGVVGSSLSQAKISSASHPGISDIVRLVRSHGWSAQLKQVCRAFSLNDATCRFHQIAVDATDDLSKHGFNVSDGVPDASYIVLFRLRPLIGEFFLLSAEGHLIAATYRAKDASYGPIPTDEARAALKSEVSYWLDNFPRIAADLTMGARQ
jgi:hypothetical protein